MTPPPRIDEQLLRRIRDSIPQNTPVVSLYLDLDPERFATPDAREAQLNSLLTEARAAELDARDAIDHIDRRLHDEWPATGSKGVAVFAAEGWLEIVELPRPVDPEVTVADSPKLEPIAEQMARETWAVLLVDRRHARILRGTPDHLEEIDNFEDLVHGQHSKGGWSQARYERSVGQDVANHMKNAAARIDFVFKTAPFQCLVVVADDEEKNDVLDHLPQEVRKRVVATTNMEIEHSTADDIEARLREIAETRDAHREKDAIERLAEQLGRGGRAVEGANDVSRALDEKRVEVLLFDQNSGAVASDLDSAIQRAIEQGAELLPVKHHLLQAQDGIAALTRF